MQFTTVPLIKTSQSDEWHPSKAPIVALPGASDGDEEF